MAYTSPIKPRIRFFEGVEGIQQMLWDACNGKQDYFGFTDYALMPDEMYRYIQDKVVPQRKKNGIILRLLVPRNETNKRVIKEYRRQVQHRMVDFPSRKNHIEILLYEGSKIGFMSFVKNERFGVLMDSKAIYQTLHDLFMVVWNATESK